MNLYILDKLGYPVRADTLTWGKWLETADRVVVRDEVGEVSVSTVFLGVDHSFSRSGPPILYETMVFGGPLDETQERYATREQARVGHMRILAEVLAAQTRGIVLRPEDAP